MSEVQSQPSQQQALEHHIQLKLASLGLQLDHSQDPISEELLNVSASLVESYREKSRLLSDYFAPIDFRIQRFLERFLSQSRHIDEVPRLPVQTFVLDRPGLARELSLPRHSNHYRNPLLESYRLSNGVLHNPASDRRTTAGSFHIAEGSLPIPGDKRAVPNGVFAKLLDSALNPDRKLLELPYTSEDPEDQRIALFASLLLRPIVCPEVPGISPEKRMEVHFFAPGNLVSNLDFVESIFGNGGDPHLAEHDAGLDVDGWTGQTGCVILAPQITKLRKKDLGLPHWDKATERQRHDRMCWQEEDELYNDGKAFKITARDRHGVIITLIGDNYFGYSKKEIKTQIGFSANLFGNAEEEHAGGALVFNRYHHGDDFGVDPRTRNLDWTFDEVLDRYGDRIEIQPEGHGIDKQHPNLIYVPEDLNMDLRKQTVMWTRHGETQQIKMQPGKVYMHPAGYKVHMERHPKTPSWRLVGTEPEGTFCHKPYTVSGGGKSEISKSIEDTILYRSVFVDDIEADLDAVTEIINKDFRDARRPELRGDKSHDCNRPFLSPTRSLGSVIRLLTPSRSRYTEEYNDWVRSLPDHIRSLAFIIKRFYKEEWAGDWRSHLSVDFINGQPGHELKLDGRKILSGYLRVGFRQDGSWRVFKLRQDFIAAEKIQREDDITASTIVPSQRLNNLPEKNHFPAVKLTVNCESRLFQRPDDAIIRGHDKQTEQDFAEPDNFFSNYQPLEQDDVQRLVDDAIGMQEYTQPMHDHLIQVQTNQDEYAVASSHPRRVNGKITKNPRYLQIRDDLRNDFPSYVADMGTRLHRRLNSDQQVNHPVDAILMGRRNNPAAEGIKPLAVYGPLHYQELPELFMDLITSITGKSPSTTGAGSEGALTKGPFNALRTTADLNAALVGLILTQYPVFSSAAGHIGRHSRMDHDISLLVPEIWARLPVEYRDPKVLLENSMLEALNDFEYEGRIIPASRLGYRITTTFAHHFLGRIFDSPTRVFGEDLLRPETQSLSDYVDGIDNIVDAQRRVAQGYIDDGSIEEAAPPLQALLQIMATGQFDHNGEAKDIHHPDIRRMFTREAMLDSNWYRQRLETKAHRDLKHYTSLVKNLKWFLTRKTHLDQITELGLHQRLQRAEAEQQRCSSSDYLEELNGFPGTDPM